MYSFQENYFEIGRTGIPACCLKGYYKLRRQQAMRIFIFYQWLR
jgi:hypothetical protein